MREMAEKARVTINATWGLIERTARSTFSGRMYLYNSLVRAGALFGVELWGWEDNKEMKAVYGRYCKAALGLAKNTPEYIWRTESSAERWKVSCRRRASKYILDILGMKDRRWPKVCLRETCRGILSGRPSKWGTGLVKALDEMKCSDVIQIIWDKEEAVMIEQRLIAGLNSLMKKMRLEDDKKIMESTFNRRYKFLKTNIETEPYWADSRIPGWIKEV